MSLINEQILEELHQDQIDILSDIYEEEKWLLYEQEAIIEVKEETCKSQLKTT
jgi:hypothetical protein